MILILLFYFFIVKFTSEKKNVHFGFIYPYTPMSVFHRTWESTKFLALTHIGVHVYG